MSQFIPFLPPFLPSLKLKYLKTLFYGTLVVEIKLLHQSILQGLDYGTNLGRYCNWTQA